MNDQISTKATRDYSRSSTAAALDFELASIGHAARFIAGKYRAADDVTFVENDVAVLAGLIERLVLALTPPVGPRPVDAPMSRPALRVVDVDSAAGATDARAGNDDDRSSPPPAAAAPAKRTRSRKAAGSQPASVTEVA